MNKIFTFLLLLILSSSLLSALQVNPAMPAIISYLLSDSSTGPFMLTTDASNFTIGEDASTNTQEITWIFSHPITSDTLSANIGSFFDTDNVGVSVSPTTNIITATNVAIEAGWDGIGGTGVQTVLDGIDSGQTSFGASVLNNTNTQMTLSADKKVVVFSFRTVSPTNIISSDRVIFTGSSNDNSAFTSTLTADEILTVSGSSKNTADQVDPFMLTTDASNFTIGEDASTNTQEITWIFSHPITSDTLSANIGSFFDTDNVGVSVSPTTNIITATNVAIEAGWDGIGGTGVQTVLDGIDSGQTSFGASVLNNTNTQMTLSADKKVVVFSFRTVSPTNIISSDRVIFTGSSNDNSAFTSTLTADEILTVSGSSTY